MARKIQDSNDVATVNTMANNSTHYHHIVRSLEAQGTSRIPDNVMLLGNYHVIFRELVT